jgi:hypothetical protein
MIKTVEFSNEELLALLKEKALESLGIPIEEQHRYKLSHEFYSTYSTYTLKVEYVPPTKADILTDIGNKILTAEKDSV